MSMRAEMATWPTDWLIRFVKCFMGMGGNMGAFALMAKQELDRRPVPLVLGPLDVMEIDRWMDQHAAERAAKHTCAECGCGFGDRAGHKPCCPNCGWMPNNAAEQRS